MIMLIKPNFKPSLYPCSFVFNPFFIPIIREYISIDIRLIREFNLLFKGNIRFMIVKNIDINII